MSEDEEGEEPPHFQPPPGGMLAELQRRQQTKTEGGAKSFTLPPKQVQPPVSSPKSSGGEQSLQEKLAARRAKVDNPDAMPSATISPPARPPATISTAPAPPSPTKRPPPRPTVSATPTTIAAPPKRSPQIALEEDAIPPTASPPSPASLSNSVKVQPEGRARTAPAPRPSITAEEPVSKRAAPVVVAKKVEPLAPAEKMEVSPSLVARKKTEPLVGKKSTSLANAALVEAADDPADWITHTTADGEPYYVNKRTGKTTWDKPAALLAEGEQTELEGDWVWVQHEQLAWIPAKVVKKMSDGNFEVIEQYEGSDNERRTVKAKEVGPKITSAKHITNLTSDLVQLDEVHEPGIIDLLRRRYHRDKIYTSVGDILIAINPFKPTPLFTTQIMHQYADRTKTAMELPPHPYAVINGSLQDLIEFSKDQSLLISGESGAGKTVTVKVCLEFVSEVAGSSDNVEEQILASNPLLEAFGNAKTKRNDNSSRFGKFMEVHLNKDSGYKIVGCSVVHYLLEKSRVVAQAEGERNFHVFYYVVSHATEQERKALFIDNRSPETFKFLSQDGSPCADPEQHDDVEECSAMRNSFKDMNVSPESMMDCFKIVAAVLHLGDIEFEEFQSTGSKISNQSSVEKAAKLLGVAADLLEKVLTKHESQQRDGLLSRAFNPAIAADARNALARHTYGRLFDYLIRMVNKAMNAESLKKLDTRYIGMLDIFGFEIFEVNSFEQLCINFANEKLQQLFNRHTFTLEEKTYQEEGIEFDHITFHDSQPLLTFLGLGESKDSTIRDGVFQILDEQTVVGSGTDEKFLQAIGQRHRDKKNLFSDLCKIKTRFKVNHYAGTVEYETSGFVAKNADKLYENIIDLMRSSSSKFIAESLYGSEILSTVDDIGGSMKPKTQASLFMRQLQALEARTNSTFPRYIRCVKPNGAKKPRLFESVICFQQLRFAGVFEAVSIRKLGFPFRHTHQHFFEYFKCLCNYDHDKWMAANKLVNEGQSVKTAFTALAKKLWQDIVAGPVPEAKDCRFGKSMVLFRAKEHRSLEIARLSVLNKNAAVIQKVAKGRYVRRHTPEVRKARELLEAAIISRDESRLDKEIAASSVLFFKVKAQYDAEAVRASVRQEKKIKPKLENLLKLDPDKDPSFEQLEAAVIEMDSYVAKDPLAFANMQEAHNVRAVYFLSKERRVLKQDLQNRLQEIPHSRCAESIGKLESELKRAEDLAKRGQASGGSRFYQNEMEEAKENLSHLKIEASLCKKSVDSAAKSRLLGEVNHVQPGDLDSSHCRSNVMVLRQDLESLRNHVPKSADTIEAMVAMETILDLRESALIALDLGEGAAADEAEWRRVESVLRDVRGLTLEFDLYTVDIDEVDLVANDLALRAAVDDVVNKLNEAITAVDDEQLTVAIDQAKVLKMFDHPDENIRNVCYNADEILPKVQSCRALLAEGLRDVNEIVLREALCQQSAIGFGVEPGMLGHDVVLRARQLYAWVLELTAEARLAAQVMYTEPSEVIVKGCDEIRLQLSFLEPVRAMLKMSKYDRLIRQRDASLLCKNYRRAVRLDVEASDTKLESQDPETLALGNFPGLKTPEDFSRRFGIHWKRYKDGMLTFYNPLFGKIHTSLTHIEGKDEEETKELNKKAPYLFKNVFAVMGDRKVVEVDATAHELLEQCLQIPALRNEVYCQLMKQLTQNPNSESESRGWNLMAMCCATFPPGSDLEKYLEFFLKKAYREDCVWKLHMTLIGGPLVVVPPVEVVARLRQNAATGDTSFWMPGPRTQISFEELQFSAPEKIEQIVQDWRAARYQPGLEFVEKRLSKRRNSGGFEIHIGGEAPKIGPGGLSRVPSFMLSSSQLIGVQQGTSARNSTPPGKSAGPPQRPGTGSSVPAKPISFASAPPSKPMHGVPPAKPQQPPKFSFEHETPAAQAAPSKPMKSPPPRPTPPKPLAKPIPATSAEDLDEPVKPKLPVPTQQVNEAHAKPPTAPPKPISAPPRPPVKSGPPPPPKSKPPVREEPETDVL